MKSKTIILSSENEKGRGILTIFQDADLLQCRIRLYNLSPLNRYCKIGVYHNQQVYSANLLEKNGAYTSSMVGDFNIDQDFYTAIIDTQNNNNVILSGGTYAGFFFNDNSVFDNEFSPKQDDFVPAKFNENFETVKPNKNPFDKIEKSNPNTNLFDYGDELQFQQKYEESFSNHDKINNLECNYQCKNCKYKEFFYSQNKHDQDSASEEKVDENKDNFQIDNNNLITTSSKPDNNTETNLEKQVVENDKHDENTHNSKHTIIEALIPQFKYVFENYPEDELLNNLLDNSKFVKITENDVSYSIGVIYNDAEIKYICYAVMCDYNTPVPTELGEHYQWLPIDKEDPLSEGYYIVFQDAQDLKIVEV